MSGQSPLGSALPQGERVVTLPRGWTVRIHTRTWVVATVLFAALVVVFFGSLISGDFRVSPSALIQTLTGEAPSRTVEFFVMERRMPRVLVAFAVGASLAISGAAFQSMTGNPLASPDVIGVTSGAAAGACFVFLVVEGSIAQASIGALVGALATAGIMGLLALRGGLQGTRLILIGIALGALASSLVSFMLTKVFVASAVTAQSWLIGSLQGRGWIELRPIALAMIVLIPALLAFSSALRAMELGDDVARSLGVPIDKVRAAVLIIATLLVAIAVATAGPISFLALAAPHLARGLCKSSALVPTALLGALLLAASDLVAQYVFPFPIPVGVVTVTIGGLFFLGLLWREGRRG